MDRRIAITGLGVVSPAGIGREQLWQASLRRNKSPSGARPAGSTGNTVPALDLTGFLTPKTVNQTDRSVQFALVACELAARDAGIDLQDGQGADAGMWFSTQFGGMDFAEPELFQCTFGDPMQVSAYQSIAWFFAAAQGQFSIFRRILGPGRSLVAGHTGGLQAIGWAGRAIQDCQANLVFAGGHEAPLSPYAYEIHRSSGLLAASSSYRPFDQRGTGLVLGEAAAIVVLEDRDRAIGRGATIYAELAGFAVRQAPRPTGSGSSDRDDAALIAHAVGAALDEAGVPRNQVGYVCANGWGQPAHDLQELGAYEGVFAECSPGPWIGCPKPITGHCVGAAGALDVVWTAMMLRERLLLPTPGLEHPHQTRRVRLLAEAPRQMEGEAAVVVARSLEGGIAVIVLKADKQDAQDGC